MRTVLVSSVSLLLGLGCANATTYQLTYTGQKMVGQSGGGKEPIRGVKHFSFAIQSASPFAKNACFDIAPAEVTVFTDGVDTPA